MYFRTKKGDERMLMRYIVFQAFNLKLNADAILEITNKYSLVLPVPTDCRLHLSCRIQYPYCLYALPVKRPRCERL